MEEKDIFPERYKDGSVVITANTMFGLLPVMRFLNWDTFIEFVANLNEFTDKHKGSIPDSVLKAFGEEND